MRQRIIGIEKKIKQLQTRIQKNQNLINRGYTENQQQNPKLDGSHKLGQSSLFNTRRITRHTVQRLKAEIQQDRQQLAGLREEKQTLEDLQEKSLQESIFNTN